MDPIQTLVGSNPDFSIVDRIDELRDMRVEVTPSTVDKVVMQMLVAVKRGIRVGTFYRRLVFGIEYMERMRVYSDGYTVRGDFVLVGDDPRCIAAWRYSLPVRHPRFIEALYG